MHVVHEYAAEKWKHFLPHSKILTHVKTYKKTRIEIVYIQCAVQQAARKTTQPLYSTTITLSLWMLYIKYICMYVFINNNNVLTSSISENAAGVAETTTTN